MELWIRSQDRTTLIRSYEIYIAEHSNSYVIRAKRTSHILGAYKTIERALEVLDEIQKIIGWLQKDMKYVTFGDEKSLKGCFKDYVYEMPVDQKGYRV